MSLFLTIITGSSFIALAIFIIFHALTSGEWKKFVFHAVAIFLFGVILNQAFGFPSVRDLPPNKGAENDEIYFTIVLYFFMLLGMLCQHLYARFSKPKGKRRKFDLGLFVAPIFASPIVFIPLFAALQNAEVDLSGFSAPGIMIFFVAFENGFFWKELVNQRLENKRNETGVD